MTSSIILAVLAIAGLATLILKLAMDLRERLLEDGWFQEDSWLGKMRRRGMQRRLTPALAAIGITADHFDSLRRAAADEAASRRLSEKALRSRPDEALLAAIKPWIVRLDDGATFRGNDRYIDTMGLVHNRERGRPSLAAIADAWVTLLRRAEKIESFDCVITLKDGNPVLVTDFCNRISPTKIVKPILCKSEADPSRITRDDAGPHETDFEGLRAFLETAGRPREPRKSYRALALDDNCTSGHSLLSAIEEFNTFVTAQPDKFPIEPITQAVVLFVVNAGEKMEFAFDQSDIELHAMLAIGPEEMRSIEQTDRRKLGELAGQIKTHPACGYARSLGVTSTGPAPTAP